MERDTGGLNMDRKKITITGNLSEIIPMISEVWEMEISHNLTVRAALPSRIMADELSCLESDMRAIDAICEIWEVK